MAVKKRKRVCRECGGELPGRRWLAICWFCRHRKKKEIEDALQKENGPETVEEAVQPDGGQSSSQERAEQCTDAGRYPTLDGLRAAFVECKRIYR